MTEVWKCNRHIIVSMYAGSDQYNDKTETVHIEHWDNDDRLSALFVRNGLQACLVHQITEVSYFK